ncbi:MAG: hypothetical protein U0136_19720 [Bdellovibrionota bacterium]
MRVQPTSGDVSSLLSRTEARTARASRREARAARRAASAQAPTASSDAATDQTSNPQASAQSSITQAPEAPKSFIGNTKGSSIVHFAVQGGFTGNSVSIFATGEGPSARKPEQTAQAKSEAGAATPTDSTSVDKIA